METVLQLFKLDIGISHTSRDAYFNALIESTIKEIEGKGIKLDLSKVEDQILISDYASWTYRNRATNIPLSRNLDYRIKNRIVKARSEKNVG